MENCLTDATTVTAETLAPKVEEIQTKQIGFITKGGGLNIDEWIRREKEKYAPVELVTKDFPTHVEIHQVLPPLKKK